ncbi:hypothetical protein D9619_009529 [Psilocybe cf. subviscida]|uniref:Electron transfer flavoprotein-ubiquinone oxidoreductase n=1 Tax=Psilocybe cf. subviscida TaxID=2480587 RepID=A0A8H5BKX4_9AGAR|nr:hypothetical protein D9619_009529 [Psilocybe cf. subviscida]
MSMVSRYTLECWRAAPSDRPGGRECLVGQYSVQRTMYRYKRDHAHGQLPHKVVPRARDDIPRESHPPRRGAHGSLSNQAISMYQLRKEVGPQTYGIGVKEVWRVDPEKHRPGEVVHTPGWPLQSNTYGGGWPWVYHMDGGLVSLGLVVGLDYKNPSSAPIANSRHHPYFRNLFQSPTAGRLSHGARVLTEGGFHSIPKLNFTGGALIWCSACFINVAKLKGTHNAMKSGILAAETVYDVVHPAEHCWQEPVFILEIQEKYVREKQ